MTWRDRASCVDIDPAVFFPHPGNPRGRVTKESKALALAMCAGCGVAVACLDYALRTPVAADFGIWGGTTVTQRVRLREQRRAA